MKSRGIWALMVRYELAGFQFSKTGDCEGEQAGRMVPSKGPLSVHLDHSRAAEWFNELSFPRGRA